MEVQGRIFEQLRHIEYNFVSNMSDVNISTIIHVKKITLMSYESDKYILMFSCLHPRTQLQPLNTQEAGVRTLHNIWLGVGINITQP